VRRSALVLILLFVIFTHHATAAKAHSWLAKETKFGTGVKTGSSVLQYHDTCVWVQVFFISEKFFQGLQKKETPTGTEFSKGGTQLQDFPARLIVDFEATVQKCNPTPDEILPPDYATGLMTGATFEVSWKTGTQKRSVLLQSTEEQHRPGLRWDYFLAIPAKGVPLTDELVIDVSLRHGISRASLSASLDPRPNDH